jgi:hypothetical protein
MIAFEDIWNEEEVPSFEEGTTTEKRRNLRAERFKRAVRNLFESVDEVCVSICSKGVLSFQSGSNSQSSVQTTGQLSHLESLNVSVSNKDLKDFTTKGVIFDGTFHVDEKHFSGDNEDYTRDEEKCEEETVADLDSYFPPPSPETVKLIRSNERSSFLGWF